MTISNNKVRIGNTVMMRFRLTTNGESLPLDGRDIKVLLRDPRGVASALPYTIEDTCVVCARFEGAEQKTVGKHIIEVWENRGKASQAVIDFDAIELVARSFQE